MAPAPLRGAPANPPIALHERAEADLAFVRSVVERSTRFTAVPGIGGVLMGVTALVSAVVASRQPDRESWLVVWVTELVLASGIGLFTTVRKARHANLPLGAGPSRRFALGLLPPLVVGGVLTIAAYRIEAWPMLPPIWLSCYGIGVLGAGAMSAAPVVPTMGAAFMFAGMLAVATPTAWGDIWLGLAFGAAHIVTGLVIARHHGG